MHRYAARQGDITVTTVSTHARFDVERWPSLIPFLLMATMNAQAQTARAPDPTTSEYQAIVGIASKAATAELKQTARLEPSVLNVSGDWAFLFADIVDAHGAPFDYRGSALEAAAAAGGVSRSYAGLLRMKGGEWSMVVQAIGPTDVAWEPWPARYGAPEAVFAID